MVDARPQEFDRGLLSKDKLHALRGPPAELGKPGSRDGREGIGGCVWCSVLSILDGVLGDETAYGWRGVAAVKGKRHPL